MNVDQAFYELVRLVRRFQALGKHLISINHIFVVFCDIYVAMYPLQFYTFVFDFYFGFVERPGSADDENDAYDGGRRRGGGGRKKCTILQLRAIRVLLFDNFIENILKTFEEKAYKVLAM